MNLKDIQAASHRMVRVKKLRRVEQLNSNGCFIAAFAICLGTTYEESFKLVHPGTPYTSEYWSYGHGLHPFRAYEIAAKHLRMFREAKERRFRDFKTNALVTVKWRYAPHLAHALVWDFKNQRILDPGGRNSHTLKELESQIFLVHYFKRPIVTSKDAPSVSHEQSFNQV